jgi:hypothetical protein
MNSTRIVQFVLLTCCFPVFAQTKKAVGAASSPGYSQIPFDPSTPRLPVHFMGNDLVRLFKAHEALRTAEKSEYETSEQFNKRIELAETKFFMGSEVGTTLSFFVPAVSEYDADGLILNAGVECSTPSGIIHDKATNTISARRHSTERVYLASNAYGAKITVHENDVESYRLSITNPDDFEITESKHLIMAHIKATTEEARRIRSTLAALAICSISRGEELTADDAILSKATFDNPLEYFEQIHVLKTKLLSIWIFDSISGRVYSKAEPVQAIR